MLNALSGSPFFMLPTSKKKKKNHKGVGKVIIQILQNMKLRHQIGGNSELQGLLSVRFESIQGSQDSRVHACINGHEQKSTR